MKVTKVLINFACFIIYRFPDDRKWKRRWLRNLRRTNFIPSTETRICSIHFEESCFKECAFRRLLKEDALPTIFPSYEKKDKVISNKYRVCFFNFKLKIFPFYELKFYRFMSFCLLSLKWKLSPNSCRW